ncbi:MAG: outer rane autotransporter barrel domain protein [Variovorax sp.]|nr:outer rane autotransporter barrel domain protein [Variovorax sp.]
MQEVRQRGYLGNTALNAGGLVLGADTAPGAGTLNAAGGTTLDASSVVALNNAVNLGGAIGIGGTADMRLNGPVNSASSPTKNGAATLTLAGANGYLGGTTLNAGQLVVGNSSSLGQGNLTVGGASTLQAGAVNAFSAASAHTVAVGAPLDLAGHNQTVAALTNAGTVNLLSSAPGTTLTVTGPYVGNNGVLKMGTALVDSSSLSDRLVLSGPGAVASGHTTLQITNLGGLGAQTTGNGIEVVSARNGATSTSTAFALNGDHVDAGAFQYRLFAADANGQAGSCSSVRRRPPVRRTRPFLRCRQHRCTAPRCRCTRRWPTCCARTTWPCWATCTAAWATKPHRLHLDRTRAGRDLVGDQVGEPVRRSGQAVPLGRQRCPGEDLGGGVAGGEVRF